jgi:WD40 repeat protein
LAGGVPHREASEGGEPPLGSHEEVMPAGDANGGSVFLCHNNSDKEAVKRIADALELEFGTRYFLDAYAIPVGVEFLEWIERSLAASSGCAIFLGAKGWGPTHLWEAEKALARYRQDSGYKLIPVALPGIAQADAAKLGSGKIFQQMNWADFTQGLGDKDSLTKLNAALTGGELPQHRGPARLTPYQVRRDAERWEKSERKDKSILYRGAQLSQAEQLLQANPDYMVVDEIAPFLTASNRRQRAFWQRTALTGGVAAALILLLAVAAVIGYFVAEDRRSASVSRQLSIVSQDAPDPARSLLAATRAILTARTPEAEGNLIHQLYEWRHLRRIVRADNYVSSLTIRADSGEIVVAADSARIEAWAADGSEHRDLLKGQKSNFVATSVAADPGGGLWVGRADGSLELFVNDASDNSGIASVAVLPTDVQVGVGQDPRISVIEAQDSIAAVGSARGRLSLIDQKDHSILLGFDEDYGEITSLSFDNAGRWLAVGTADSVVLIVDVLHLKIVERIPRFGGRIIGVGFYGRDTQLLVVAAEGRLSSVRYRDGEWVTSYVNDLPPLGLAAEVSRQGLIALGDALGNVFLFDSIGSAHSFGSHRGHSDAITALVFSRDEKSLVSASSNGSVDIWDIDGKLGPASDLPPMPVEPAYLTEDATGNLVAAGLGHRKAGIWKLDNGTWREITDLISDATNIIGPTVFDQVRASSPDGFVPLQEQEIPIIALAANGQRAVWATRSGYVVAQDLVRKIATVLPRSLVGQLASITLNADGAIIALLPSDDDHIEVFHLGAEMEVDDHDVLDLKSDVRSIALDDPGGTLAVGFSDGRIGLWKSTGDVLNAPVQIHSAPVAGMVFSRARQSLFSYGSGGGGVDRTVAVSDLPNMSPSVRLQARQVSGSVSSMAVGSLANILAAADNDGNVLLWTLDELRFSTALKAGSSYIAAVAFNEHQRRLITFSGDGSFLTWNLDVDYLMALACTKANRDLSEDEWRELLPDDTFQSTCEEPGSVGRQQLP